MALSAIGRRGTMRSRDSDLLAVLLVWAVMLALSLFLAPLHHDASAYEPFYYSTYDVAVGAFVGLSLFRRLAGRDASRFIAFATGLVLVGTCFNEMLVEPLLFGSREINGQGLFYGMQSTVATIGIFMMTGLAQQGWQFEPAPPVPAQRSADAPFLFVKVSGRTIRLDPQRVVRLEADRDYTRVICEDRELFVSEGLKYLAARCAPHGITRVHRSHAVALDRVRTLEGDQLDMDGHCVPIGRRYRDAFLNAWQGQA